MMNIRFQTFLHLSILLVFSTCQKSNTELSKLFSCEKTPSISNLESVTDFKNNFSIQTPKHWNTKLYYDNVQSEIFTADTIKALTDSFIMSYSARSSSLKINEKLKEKVQQKTEEHALETVKESFLTFKEHKSFVNLSKGTKRGMAFHVFQYYIKLNEDKYLLIKTEFYGAENFQTRFCESISLINKIQFH